MNAQKAREITRQNLSADGPVLKPLLEQVYTAIQQAARKGYYGLDLAAFLPSSVDYHTRTALFNALRGQGYHVKTLSDRNEDYTSVSWTDDSGR